MKRRWPLILLALLLLVLVGALAVAVVRSRTIEGAVPGRSPVLSFAVSGTEIVVGTANSLFFSNDGKSWKRPDPYTKGRYLPTSWPGGVAVASGGELLIFEPADGKPRTLATIPSQVVAVASDPHGRIYVVDSSSKITVVQPNGEAGFIQPRRGPREVLAIDVSAGRAASEAPLRSGPAGKVAPFAAIDGSGPVFFAGGLTSGVWRSTEPDKSWAKVLQTPVRAIMADDNSADTIFLATSGGLLVSSNSGFSWDFTKLRLPVEALSQGRGRYWALTSQRLLYSSPDGLTGWEPLAIATGGSDPSGAG